MPFRVKARTLLHLGAELISSDAIAFYELIKNAFDAGSEKVQISVVIRLPYNSQEEFRSRLLNMRTVMSDQKTPQSAISNFCEEIAQHIDVSAPYADIAWDELAQAQSWDDIQDIIEEANYILIEDTGEGMSLDDLNEVYLTIGTQYRLKQREERLQNRSNASNSSDNIKRPILGEKGVGRLSAMRLGNRLVVETSKRGESHTNKLSIDWSKFSHESDNFIEDIDVSPALGSIKSSLHTSGTSLRISGLTSHWDRSTLLDIAQQEFNKLTDPFTSQAYYPIILRFNGNIITIPQFDQSVFAHAHATVSASFSITDKDGPRLAGRIQYTLRRREKTFELKVADILSIADVGSLQTLQSLGPFSVQFYWFNRRLFQAIDGIGERKRVDALVNQWAGGLMVYRDGFRVKPYGGPEDDWLNLDKRALGSSGYKVNRRQIIGKVDISSLRNSQLVDQTNREGLRDNSESRALKKLLQHIFWSQFKPFLDIADKEIHAQEVLNIDDLEVRAQIQERQVQHNMQLLLKKHPQISSETTIINRINDSTNAIRTLINQVKQLADEYQSERNQMVHLAGLGLMVEILAHELNRATSHTLITLSGRKTNGLPSDVVSLFNTLEAQLKTLQKRLRILDPLSISGRQVREKFNLVGWGEDILRSHEGQFRRHNIRMKFLVEPDKAQRSFEITAVKGMIVQILENLMSNSVYWLKQQKKLNTSFEPQITVIVNTSTKQILFSDNGPGIQLARKEEIFQPFVTTKPPGEGKGLGLYISREVAKYNGAELYLSPVPGLESESLNTFILSLEVNDK